MIRVVKRDNECIESCKLILVCRQTGSSHSWSRVCVWCGDGCWALEISASQQVYISSLCQQRYCTHDEDNLWLFSNFCIIRIFPPFALTSPHSVHSVCDFVNHPVWTSAQISHYRYPVCSSPSSKQSHLCFLIISSSTCHPEYLEINQDIVVKYWDVWWYDDIINYVYKSSADVDMYDVLWGCDIESLMVIWWWC